MSYLAENIKAIWKDSGLTQKEFAEQFGSTDKAIWTYIHGRAEPNGAFLLRLCEHFSIDIHFLYERKIIIKRNKILNRPDKGNKARELKVKAIELLNQTREVQAGIEAELRSLITELEQLSRKK
jgi:transcriptional regulator with XRE-family HTH domain